MTTEELIEWVDKEITERTFDFIRIFIKEKPNLKWLTNNFIVLINQDFRNNELKFEKIPEYIKYLKGLGLDEVCEHLNDAKHKFRKQKIKKLYENR